MVRRRYTPFDIYGRPFKSVDMTEIMKEMNEIFNHLLSDDTTAEAMSNLSKDQEIGIGLKKDRLKSTVERNGRKYEIIISDITEDKPDEITSFNWETKDFGSHEDLTE